MSEKAPAFVRPLLAFLVFNLAVRGAALGDVFFINEDAALVTGARELFSSSPLFRPLFEAYGPGFIRPWQLWGLYVEQGLLGLSAPASVAVGLGIFSAALAIVFASLREHVGDFGAAIGCLLASGTPVSGEPLLWLSDRHDVYLAFFFACALACSLALATRKLALGPGLGLLTLAFWGAFYSNEKSTAVPAVVSAAALALLLGRAELRREWRRMAAVVTVSLANLGAYFALRHAVLGKLVGGYDDRVIGSGELSSAALHHLLRNVLTLPLFSQTEPNPALAQALLATLGLVLVGLGALLVRRRDRIFRALGVGVLLYVALVISAVPTLRHFLAEAPGWEGLGALGPLNARNLWLPHLVSSLILGVVLGVVFTHTRAKVAKGALVVCGLALVLNHAHQAMTTSARFARAGRLTREVVSVMSTHCACADVRSGQVSGVPAIYAGVNTLTEPMWLDCNLHRTGAPRCRDGEPRCSIAVYVSATHEPTIAPRTSSRHAP